ncbi:MAG: hypothetical protein HFP78_05220 [Methylococcales symbiont of Hymedesmia sp. n. MRB-2018]|nr:MAG: hypothetical protein HFP78_05220 [Methylococcales symbiont of Hymedesmia sp. n. MRB-2018]
MFDNDYFERWLDSEASKAMEKITNHESIDQQEMMVLVLKAQTNHITQMEQDLRGEMIALREDMDKRFEQINKRFEQVDKRFEQVDKRFDTMIARMDKFMIWSFSNTFIAAGIVVALVKYL